MKILFVGLARALWLFDTSLLNPRGINIQPAIKGIGEKYEFAQFPKSPLDVDAQKGLAFRAGTFVNSQGNRVLITFTIYTDGLIADTTSSTDDSTAFLYELTQWLNIEFHLAVPAEIRKAFVSQMDVECEYSLVNLNPRLSHFVHSIESLVKPVDGRMRPFDLGGISFWTEDVTKLGAPAIFKFERKWSAPFSANHYFSQGPFETKGHVRLLDELELLLSS